MLRIFFAMFGNAHFFRVTAHAGLFGPATIIAHASPLGEEERDAPLMRLGHALHHRPVNLLGLARAKQFAEVGGHFARARDEQDARCVAIKTMHEQRAITLFIGHRHEHAINMVLGARAALYGQPIGLVEHDDMLVFENRHLADAARIGIRHDGAFHGGLGNRLFNFQRRHAHGIAFSQTRRRLGARTINTHLTGAANLVEVAQRQRRHAALEPAVQSHAIFICCHGQRLHATLFVGHITHEKDLTTERPRKRPTTASVTLATT